ncbi:MAG: poly-gamma-glutamate synthase PgsB [Clostridium sp.]
MKLFILFFFLLLLYFTIENIINRRCLASFKSIIHVNGIRGKTSTCRYIDAALRKRYRVFTKTTGTDAMMIHADGRETPVKRLGPANIHEQLRMIRKAHREGAEILILECMAVNPMLQKIAQEKIVRSDITVITNVRYDHIFEMGETLDEIAESLSGTVPNHGTLFTSDSTYAAFFEQKCKGKNSQLVLCPPSCGLGTLPSYIVEENLSIAQKISDFLGVSGEEFRESLSEIKEDFGVKCIYPIQNKSGGEFYFLNLFSANDPQSTINNINEVRSNYKDICFLYNHRGDRPDRALLFARYFFPYFKESTVYLVGKGSPLPKRLFSGAGIRDLRVISDYRESMNLPEGFLLVGIGNIKGAGYDMIELMENGGLSHE